jgi:hypothetical protein
MKAEKTTKKTASAQGEDFASYLWQKSFQEEAPRPGTKARKARAPKLASTPIQSEKRSVTKERKAVFERTRYLAGVAEKYLEDGSSKTRTMPVEMERWAQTAHAVLDKHSSKAAKRKTLDKVEEILNKPVLKREHYDKHEFDIFSKTTATIICVWFLALFVVINYPASAKRMAAAFDHIYASSIGRLLPSETGAEPAGRVAGASERPEEADDDYSGFLGKIMKNY